MSDEAFARRFYSDRAELTALGVPLHSQRDEFTGEELYTLRSENYFLDRLDLKDDELAALQTALFYLDGKFAYAEPLRLALQNLALGRPGFPEARDRHGRARPRQRTRLLARARRATVQARVGDLEAADDQVLVLVAAARQGLRAHAQPVCTPARRGRLVRHRPGPRPRRRPHVPRLAHPQRHPLRDAARARFPAARRVRRRGASRAAALADRRDRRDGADRGPGRHRLVGAPHARRRGRARGRRLRDRLRADRAARRLGAAAERPRHPARARRSCARRRRRSRAPSAERHDGDRPPRLRASGASTRGATRATAPSGPIAPERFGVLQALLAHLLPPAARAARPRSTPTSSPPASRSRARSCRTRCRCSTSSTSAAGATRSTPRSTRTPGSCASTRSCTATCSASPEADAARGARDPARDRVRRARRSPPRRTRRSIACARSSRRRSASSSWRRRRPRDVRRPRRSSSDALRRGRQAARRRDRVPEGRRRGTDDALGRAVLVRARAARLARAHLGSHRRRAAHLPARPDALGAPHRRVVRAPRGLRSAAT